MQSRGSGIETEIAIRMLTADDREELARLAGRDTAEVPVGALLGASLDGRLVAVRSLSNGTSIADPFVPSADVASLLARRARQLRAERRPGLLAKLRRRRSRAALASSPPGAGGRLLEI